VLKRVLVSAEATCQEPQTLTILTDLLGNGFRKVEFRDDGKSCWMVMIFVGVANCTALMVAGWCLLI
jgi:hypothetical protein